MSEDEVKKEIPGTIVSKINELNIMPNVDVAINNYLKSQRLANT